MTQDEEIRPAGVTGATQPKQAGDIYDRWWWIELSVWTERMLTRLEESEPTTVWFGLWDKVHSERNLQAAFWAVWRNEGAPGVDGQTVSQFDTEQEAELAQARRRTAEQTLPPTTGAPGLDTQTRLDGETTAGDTGGAGPDGGSGAEERARTDI